MKAIGRHGDLAAAVAFFLLTATGCRQVETTTRISADGSVSRTVVVRGESADIDQGIYPVPEPGDGWSEHRGPDPSDDSGKKLIVTWQRDFASVAGLDEELQRLVEAQDAIRGRVSLKRSFRWFSTLYRYTETWEQEWPFSGPAASDWFTEAEIDSIRTDRAGDALDARVEEWQARSIFEDLYGDLHAAAGTAGAEGLPSPVQLETMKETFFKALVDSFEHAEGDAEMLPVVSAVTGAVFPGTDPQAVARAVTGFLAHWSAFDDFSTRASGEGYRATLRMPGILTDTNAGDVAGTEVTWEFDPGDLAYGDYTMWAQSRVNHPWALWVSAVILLVLVGTSLLVSIRRGRG